MVANKKSKKELLRHRAEKLVSKGPPRVPEMGDTDLKNLVHQLQVHQVELEMQNEELRKAQAEIEESRSKYSDLYDFSPIGYFTFSQRGEIVEVNLTGASLLGVERGALLHRLFSAFVEPNFQSLFREHCLNVLKKTKDHCEVKLVRKDGKSFYASLESISVLQGKSFRIRSAVSDITELKKSHEALQSLSARLLEVQEEERRRFAGEVHDSFSASLSAIKYKIDFMLKEDRPANGDLEHVRNLVQMLIEESRRIQMALRPSLLDDLGILSALNWFTREFQKTYSHMEVTKEIDVEEQEIPKHVKTPIFRISQEAFHNAAKHSQAKSIRLSLGRKGGALRLEIQDDGVGIGSEILESREDRGRGLGLVSMEERASLSGGVFTIHSEVGKGTTVRVSWPLK